MWHGHYSVKHKLACLCKRAQAGACAVRQGVGNVVQGEGALGTLRPCVHMQK